MEYSKAELEELIDKAEVNLNFIKDTGNGKGLMEKIDEEIPHLTAATQFMSSMYITVYLDWLSQRLPVIKDCIFATDDISLANETYNLVSPIWKKYVVIDDYDKPTHSKEHEKSITATLDSIKRKIDRYNKARPEQQDTSTASSSAKDNGNSYINNDKILKALPDLYDCLVDDGAVSKDYIKKEDFPTCITKANIPQLKQGKSEWVKKITKFKGFIKCIRHCFTDGWYSAICKSADLTDKEMGKYNTDNTADFEATIKAKLKQNGIG